METITSINFDYIKSNNNTIEIRYYDKIYISFSARKGARSINLETYNSRTSTNKTKDNICKLLNDFLKYHNKLN